jgi:hypothetical protein
MGALKLEEFLGRYFMNAVLRTRRQIIAQE